MGNSQKSQRKKFYQMQQQIVFEALNDNQGSGRRQQQQQPATTTNTLVGSRSTVVGGANSVFANRMGIGKQMSTQSSSTPFTEEQQPPSIFSDLLHSLSSLRGDIIHRIERQQINIRPCVDQSDLGSSILSLATADDEELSRQERVMLVAFCEEQLEKYESALLSTLQSFQKYYVHSSGKDQWEQFTSDISSYKDARITLPATAHFRTHLHNTQLGGGAFSQSHITTHRQHTQSEAPSTFLRESKKSKAALAAVVFDEGDSSSSSSSRQFEEFQLILRMKNEETQQQLNFTILSRIAAAFSSIFLASYSGCGSGGELLHIEQHFKLIFIYILQAFEEVVAFFVAPKISSTPLALPIASWVTGAMKDVANKIRELFCETSGCFNSQRFARLAALPENAVGEEYCNSLRIFKQLQPAFKKNPIKAAALISEQLNKIIAIEYGHAQQAERPPEEESQYALGAEQLLPIYRKLIISAEAAASSEGETKSASLYFSLRLFDVVFAELQDKTPSFSQHVLSVAHLLKEYTVILYE